MKYGFFLVFFILGIFIYTGCGGAAGDVTGSTIVDISVTPSPISISKGDNKDLSTVIYIEGINPDGTKKQILVDECTWIVTNQTILTIKNGKISGLASGTTRVELRYSGLTKNLTVNVL